VTAAASALGVARASVRVAATSATAALVAARATQVRTPGAQLHQRARLLRDGCRAALRLHGIEVEVEGVVPAGPVLLAANHVSWLDPLVVAASIPCRPVSKMDVRGWPVIGGLAGRLGVIFHARGDSASGQRVLREVEVALAKAMPVLNFPEGTTTDGADVLPFRKGLFGVAARLAVPVVPVALRYEPAGLAWTGDATFLPHYLRLAARGRSRVRLCFGAPLFSADAGIDPSIQELGAQAAALAEVTRRQVRLMLRSAV